MIHPSTYPASPEPARPPLRAVEPMTDAAPLCATPGCRNRVNDRWEESGRICGRCAIEKDLFDRETRRERCFPGEPF